MPWISTSQVAELMASSSRTVLKRCDGLETKKGPKNATLWRSEEALPRMCGIGQEGSTSSYEAERTRLTKAQADLTELSVDEKEGSLIPAELVEKAWVDHVLAARAVLLGLPSKLAPIVVSAKTMREVEDYARSEVYRALDDLERNTAPDTGKGEQSIQKAAKDDDQRVGGRA